jgi:hypothetical protein
MCGLVAVLALGSADCVANPANAPIGVGLYRERIVGKWEMPCGADETLVLDFARDGRCSIVIEGPDYTITLAPRQYLIEGSQVYRVVNEQKMHLADFVSRDGGQPLLRSAWRGKAWLRRR